MTTLIVILLALMFGWGAATMSRRAPTGQQTTMSDGDPPPDKPPGDGN